MRKTTLTFYAVCMTIASLFAVKPLFSMDANDNTAIALRKLSPGTENHDEAPRSLSIEAYYDSDLSSVCASLNGAGTLVDVYVENLDTEEEVHYQIPGSGNSIMPISGASGCWRITFVLSNGDEYVGDFNII